MSAIELHNEISYHITSNIFKQFEYVKYLHSDINSEFETYDDFIESYKKTFRHNGIFLEEIKFRLHWNKEDDEERYWYEDNILRKELLRYYPILKTIPEDCDDDLLEEIIDIVISYFGLLK